VFGKTMVCRNIDVATQIARQHNFNTITMDGIMLPHCHHGANSCVLNGAAPFFVIHTGDQVNKKGALTGGFIDHRRSKLEAQKEIRVRPCTLKLR